MRLLAAEVVGADSGYRVGETVSLSPVRLL
jgi:hypothetical protein